MKTTKTQQEVLDSAIRGTIVIEQGHYFGKSFGHRASAAADALVKAGKLVLVETSEVKSYGSRHISFTCTYKVVA